jgi:type IV fimbrial biogenesis protein FimT
VATTGQEYPGPRAGEPREVPLPVCRPEPARTFLKGTRTAAPIPKVSSIDSIESPRGDEMNNQRGQRGITLIEACVTLAVVATVAASAAPGMRSLIDARRLDGTAGQVGHDLQFARGMSIARNQRVRFSMQSTTDGSCYVVHTGNADQCECGRGDGPAVCHGDAHELRTVRLTGADRVALRSNVASILFDPLHGTSTPTGTLRLVAADGREVRQIVNVMGRVRACSPQGSVPGYRAC